MTIVAKPSSSVEYEKCKIDEWLVGEIAEVQQKLGVEKKYKNSETGETEIRKVDQARFKFSLEGYKYPHYSRWNTLSTNERANLYKNYIQALFGERYQPDTMLDISKLAGLKVKTMWDETRLRSGDMFQFVSKIRPLNSTDVDEIELLVAEISDEEEPPITEEGGGVEPNRENGLPF